MRRRKWEKISVGKPPSDVLRTADDVSPNFGPVDALVELLVDQAADDDIVAADEVEAMLDFGAGLRVITRADDALDSRGQDEVGRLVGGEERARQCAPVGGDDADLLCARRVSVEGGGSGDVEGGASLAHIVALR